MEKKSSGQALIESIEAFLLGYVVFPNPDDALVLALWVVNTYVFQAFDAVGYVIITALTKRAGKSTLINLLAFLSKNAEKIGGATPAAMWGLMDFHGDSGSTLLADESESMSSGAAGMLRSFMNYGAYKGETIPRKIGKVVVKYPCYGPKVFALIGDLFDTVRDRSFLILLKRSSEAPKLYRYSTAEREAMPIAASIKAYVKSGALAGLTVVTPDWLTNRDQDITESLWSLAVAMGVDVEMKNRFINATARLAVEKTKPIRRHAEMSRAEDEQQIEDFGVLALRDLASVMPSETKKHTGSIHTLNAVAAMKGKPGSVWGMFHGGLTETMLAALVGRWVSPEPIREERGRGTKQLRGYHRGKVMEALRSLEGVTSEGGL